MIVHHCIGGGDFLCAFGRQVAEEGVCEGEFGAQDAADESGLQGVDVGCLLYIIQSAPFSSMFS